jgi:type IV secretion system protein VirD4
LFLPVVWWTGAITACAIEPDTNLLQILQVLTEKLDQPFSITYTPYTMRCVFTFTIAYVSGIGIYYSQKKNYRRGVEHGSAKWGDAASICKRYRDKRYTQNLILTQNFRMGLDCYKHKRNLNVLVVGGSGAGKSRAYAVVNIMQCNCSMVITDPKGGARRSSLKRTGTSQLNHCLL